MKNEDNKKKENHTEICYLCNQKFDINKDDCSHYHYDKYPICANCSEAYGFFNI
ncbi:MAG: hypothetical protein LBR15_01520 [Methanobrevibacter sp.]|jgi:hypothetical protein|nr:hypothetical protein [Candidatus Methanovirga australis]